MAAANATAIYACCSWVNPRRCLIVASVQWLNIDKLAAAFTFCKVDCTVYQRKQCVVLTHANIQTRMVNCATLTFDDVACFSKLTTEDFDAQSFAFPIHVRS